MLKTAYVIYCYDGASIDMQYVNTDHDNGFINVDADKPMLTTGSFAVRTHTGQEALIKVDDQGNITVSGDVKLV